MSKVRTTLLVSIGACALLYLGDYLSLALQIPSRPRFATVHITPYLAVPQKDGKTEFMLDDPYDETCVNSVFPHYGHNPCWYVARQRNKREDI